MAKHLTSEAADFRRIVVAFDGHQEAIADSLGIHHTSVSHRLSTELHRAWWKSYKRRRSLRRRAARQRRWRRNANARNGGGLPAALR